MTIGRPASPDRKPVGQMKCPICGKIVNVYEGHHGTGYSNHDGHGFKLSSSLMNAKFSVFDPIKKVEEEEKLFDEYAEERKELIEKNEEPEINKDGYSIFGFEF